MANTTLFPDATDTGIPAGTQLVHATSNDITTPGVYSGLIFTGTVNITCSGVTLENCLVEDTPSDWVSVLVTGNVKNVVIKNCEISGAGSNSNVTGTYGIGVGDDSQVLISNNNIHHVGSPFAIGAGQVVIEGNYAHDFYSGPGTHYNGIQVNGGNGADFSLLMDHNTIINNQIQTDAIMLDNESGPINNVTITDNLLVGGDYTVYVDGSKGSSPVTNVNISNNHLGAGIYGYWYLDSGSLGSSHYQVTSSGNVEDGAALAATLNHASNAGGSATGAGGSGTSGSGGGSPQANPPPADGGPTDSGQTSSSPSQAPGTGAPSAPVLTGDTVLHHAVKVFGTADAGDTVSLYEGARVLGTTHVGADGHFSITTPSLTPGAHTLIARSMDAEGNTSGFSQPLDPVIGQSGSHTGHSSGTDDNSSGSPGGHHNHHHNTGPSTAPSVQNQAASSDNGAAATAPQLPGSSGLPGGSDTFVFAPNFGHGLPSDAKGASWGHHAPGLAQSVFDNLASMLDHASQAGHDGGLAAGADTLTLKDLKHGVFSGHDFHFG